VEELQLDTHSSEVTDLKDGGRKRKAEKELRRLQRKRREVLPESDLQGDAYDLPG